MKEVIERRRLPSKRQSAADIKIEDESSHALQYTREDIDLPLQDLLAKLPKEIKNNAELSSNELLLRSTLRLALSRQIKARRAMSKLCTTIYDAF